MWGPLLPLQGSHADAVDGARREAKLAAGALGLDYRVHQLLGTDDRIDGAGIATVHAADTSGFVDDGGRQPFRRRLGKWQYFAPEKVGKALVGAEKKLQNEGFLAKAGDDVVAAERERVVELQLEKELLERNVAGF